MSTTSTTTLSASPHREPPDSVPLAEYETLRKENEQLRARVNRRDTAKRVGRSLGVFVLTLLACSVLTYAGWFCLFRGTAWGARARQNAEREATAYAARSGHTVVGVYCAGEVGAPADGETMCTVITTTAPAAHPLILGCDDDDPIANDGCKAHVNTP